MPGRADADAGDGALGDHLRAVARVYGPETWRVYDLLERSLDPRGPESMLALAIERLDAVSVVLDVGCRDASHLIELVRATGARGVGIDPLANLVDQARLAVDRAGLGSRIRIVRAAIQAIPSPDASFDLVWCRDVIEVVEDLDAGMAEIARVLRPGGHVIVFSVVATDRLEPREAALLVGQSLALVAPNLAEETVDAAFAGAGLAVVVKDVIGTEWREHVEERTQRVSHELLQLSRLRRRRERIVETAGEEIYGHIESNLHWGVYQLLGKLLPIVWLLRKSD